MGLGEGGGSSAFQYRKGYFILAFTIYLSKSTVEGEEGGGAERV